MAFKYFVPEIWDANMLEHLDNALVFARLFNRDYEGEIKKWGDTVNINMIGDVTIKNYTGADIDDPEEISGNTRFLTIDQAKYYNIQVKDIDQAQSMYELLDKAAKRASYRSAESADRYVISQLQAAATTGIDVKQINKESGEMETVQKTIPALGSAASPKSVSSDTAWDLLVDLGVLMDENNVPAEGRWVVIPPWYAAMLTKDARFSGGGTDGSRRVLQNGDVGEDIAGFHVYKSNLVPVTDNKWQIFAGTEDLGSYADQILETEAYRREKNFSDAVKGLHVFGAKVIRPECGAVLNVSYAKPTTT